MGTPVWIAALLLGGCNWVYGLDETRVRGPDLDDDGIFDGDVCPTVSDPDQEDSDGDLVGDACDPCRMGVQIYMDADLDGIDDGCDPCPRGAGEHDEDEDGVIDACDNCPGINAPQTNADGDDLGDACDPFPSSKQTRLVFAGFETLPEGWLPLGEVEWRIADDTVGPATPPTMSSNEGLWNRNPAADHGTSWVFEAGVTVPTSPTDNYLVGIAAKPQSGLNTGATCQIIYSTTLGWYLVAGSLSMQVTVGTSARLRMIGQPNAGTICSVDGMSTGVIGTNGKKPTPLLFTSQNLATFHYVDFLAGE